MAAGDLITEDYQAEYNGVVTSDNIELVSTDFFSASDVRLQNIDRPLDHGSFCAKGFYSGFFFTNTYEVWGTSTSDLKENLEKLFNLTELLEEEVPFVIQHPDFGKVQRNAICTKRSVSPIGIEAVVGKVHTVTAEYFSCNPRLQSNTLRSQSIAKSTVSGGLTYDLTYDLSYGSSGVGGETLTNAGTFETRPVATVYGPVNNFNLEQVTQGKKLTFNGTLGSSDYLEIDFLERSVLLNGTSSRYLWVEDVTQWWNLQPGDNEIRFNGSSAGSPTVTVTWRDSWI